MVIRSNHFFWNLYRKHKITLRLVIGILVALTLYVVPTTPAYKDAVHSLYYSRHQTFVYYLNYHDSKLAVLEGNYYFGGEKYDLDKAEKSYQLALKIDPKVREAHHQLARIYFVQGDFARALDNINEELKTDPYTLRPLYVRGLIKLSQNDLSGAEADFKTFINWSPTEWGGYNDLSFVLAKEGKYAESEAVIKQAFLKAHDSKQVSWLWNSLGLAQINERKFKEALLSFSEARKLAENLTEAEWRRAYSGNDPATDAESVKTYQQALDANIKMARSFCDTINCINL